MKKEIKNLRLASQNFKNKAYKQYKKYCHKHHKRVRDEVEFSLVDQTDELYLQNMKKVIMLVVSIEETLDNHDFSVFRIR